MGFANPAYLAFSALIPILIALYFRKNRPIRRVQPSNRLWEIVSRRLEQNSLFQKYRHSIFLILQLLVLSTLILGLSRPYFKNSLAGRVILLLDTSASMRATDVAPDRFTRAREKALAILARVDSGAQVALLTGDSTVTLRAGFGTDLAAVTAQLKALTPTDHPGPAQDEVIAAIDGLQRQGPARVYVLTDQLPAAELATALPDVSLEIHSFGERAENVAIGRLEIRPASLGGARAKGAPKGWDTEVQLLSFAPGPLTVQVSVSQKGRALATRSTPIGGKSDLVLHFEGLPITEGVVSVEVTVPTGDDFLEADNHAWAVAGRQDFSVLLVGSKASALSRVLRSVPGAKVDVLPPDLARGSPLPAADITVLESSPRPALPDRSALIFCSADGEGATPGPENPVPTHFESTHPLLKYLSLKDVNFGPTARLAPVAGDVEVLGSPAGPLILARAKEGIRQVICGFNPVSSNIALRVGFPIFAVNCLRWIGGERLSGVTRVITGEPYRVPARTEGALEILGPDSRPVPLPSAAPIPGATRLIPANCFARSGLYTVVAGTKRWTVPAILSSFGESSIVPAQTQPLVRELKNQGTAAAPQGLVRTLLMLGLIIMLAEGFLYARIGG